MTTTVEIGKFRTQEAFGKGTFLGNDPSILKEKTRAHLRTIVNLINGYLS